MSTLSTAKFQTSIDTLAQIYEVLDAVLGTGAGAGTASKGAANILADVLDTESYAPVSYLSEAAYKVSENLKSASSVNGRIMAIKSLVEDYVRALRTLEIADGETSLDTALTTRALKAHYSFNVLHYQVFGAYLTPANVFSPNVVTGRVDRAASVWAYTDGSVLDVALYAPAQLELYVPAGYTIGGVDCVVTVSCITAAGATESKVATMPSGSVAGTAVAIGTSGDVYVQTSNATVTGGTDGDRVGIRTKLLRDITTLCN
jgi:hypothetical protein